MEYTDRERISHVVRRLGFGSQPDIVADASDVHAAIAAVLDVSADNPEPPVVDPPTDMRDRGDAADGLRWWFDMLVDGPRRVEERLAWFWHDHFATDARKVRFPHLTFQQHLTIRRHALGSFADLLYEMVIDPAMLIYLDGRENSVETPNENFGREVLELHTLGRGNYTEDDVVAASQAFSGWVVVPPESRASRILDVEPWSATFVSFRHDNGVKTLLGSVAAHDAASAVDTILEQPATAVHVATKLFREIVGLQPDASTIDSISDTFRRAYSIADLVHAIADHPRFLADESIRVKKRTPLEQAVGVVQGFGGAGPRSMRAVQGFLQSTGYVPFRPPNPAGYPKGARLLSPFGLVHTFDLVAAVGEGAGGLDMETAARRLGLFDLAPETQSVLEAATDSAQRLALLINSPEYHLA